VLSRVIFTQEPHSKDRGHRGGLYQFKRADPKDNMVYYCNGDTARVYKAVNAILDITDDPKLLELIYEYGQAIREDTMGDVWEDQAEAGL